MIHQITRYITQTILTISLLFCASYASAEMVLEKPVPVGSIFIDESISNDGDWNISWSAVGETVRDENGDTYLTGGIHYQLQESSDGSPYRYIYNGDATLFHVGKRDAVNGEYSYRVRACGEGGCGRWTSPQTIEVALDSVQSVNPYSISLPCNSISGEYLVAWPTVDGVSGLIQSDSILQERLLTTTSVSPWETIYTTGNHRQNYFQVTEKASGVYEYRVLSDYEYSEHTEGEPGKVSIISPEPQRIVVEAPDTPNNLSIGLIDSNRFTVSWDSNAIQLSEVEYQLQESKITQSQSGGYGYQTIYTGDKVNVELDHEPGLYHYRVRACFTGSDILCSDWSEVINTAVIDKPNVIQGVQLLSVDALESGEFDYTLTQYSSGSFRLYFSAPDNVAYADIQSYRIRISKDGGEFKNYEEVANSLNFDFTLGHYRQYNLPVGNYQFQVQACNSLCDCGEFVTSHNHVAVLGVPSAPVTPIASSDGGRGTLGLNWQVPEGLMVSYYDIQQRDPAAYLLMSTAGRHLDSTKLFTSVTSTSIVMQRGFGDYRYRVRACNLSGCGAWSVDSNLVSVNSVGTPRAFISSASTRYESDDYLDSDGNYDVRWEDISVRVTEAVTYKVTELSLNSNVTSEYDVVAPINSLDLSGKEQGHYSYTVQACTDSVCGDKTGPLEVEVAFTPDVPSVLTAQEAGAGINIQWDSSANANRYELEQRIGDGPWQQIASQVALTYSVSPQDAGVNSYNYRVRACNGGDRFELCSVFSNEGLAVLQASYDIVEAPAPSIATAPLQPDDSDRIGTLAGEFRVSESGAAIYRIGIDAPAGTAGVAPEISLNYSSQSGNGLLGQGWNLSGLSSISRCRQTLAQDRQAKPIQWNEEDRFCLDGQRLIAVTGEYGEDGTMYKTEIDMFYTIQSKGGSKGHPGYFIVKRKDGSTSMYGATDGSKVSFGSNVLTWNLSQFQDNVGNPIKFSYLNNDGHARIAEIAYAYGEYREGALPNATITFEYENRSDPSKPNNDRTTTYIAGEKRIISTRLSNIKTFEGDQLLRDYRLNYLSDSATNAPSKIESIEMCADGNICLPATSFDWQLPPRGEFPSDQVRRSSVSFNSSRGNGDTFLTGNQLGDINGDGFTDLIYTTSTVRIRERFLDLPEVSSHQQLHYLLSEEDGSFSTDIQSFYFRDDHETPISVTVVDYNGDGQSDLFVRADTRDLSNGDLSKKWRLYLSTPQADGSWRLRYEPSVELPFDSEDVAFADLNGDGLTDAFDGIQYWLLERNTSVDETSNLYYRFSENHQTIDLSNQFNWTTQGYQTNSVTSSTVRNFSRYYGEFDDSDPEVKQSLGDINGDGVGDFLLQRGAYRIGVSNVTPGGDISFSPFGGTSPRISDHSMIVSGDINADGLSDIVYWEKDQGWRYQLSMGNGWGPIVEINATGTTTNGDVDAAEDDTIQLVDVDNDGYLDFVWKYERDLPFSSEFTTHNLKVRYWENASDGFGTEEILRQGISASRSAIFGDFNGDSVPDIAEFRSNGAYSASFDFFNGGNDRLNPNRTIAAQNIGNVVSKITNGLGAQTLIDYERLNQTDVYQKVTPNLVLDGDCIRWYGRSLCREVLQNNYRAFNSPFSALPDGNDILQVEPLTPVFAANGPIPIVTNVNSSAPTKYDANALSSIEYAYGRYRMQAGGRGSLGFEYLSTTDMQTGIVTRTTYRQDWPFTGVPLLTEVRSAQNQLLSRSTNEWRLRNFDGKSEAAITEMLTTAHDLGTAKLGPVQSYLARTTQEKYALKDRGVSQGILLNAQVTESEQDNYGNLTKSIITDYDNQYQFENHSPSDFVMRATTTNEYGSSLYSLSMGRLSRTEVIRERAGYSKLRNRVTEFTYDDGSVNLDHKGLLKTELIEPNGDRSIRYKKEYFYDQFGNVTHYQSTAWNGDKDQNDQPVGTDETRLGERTVYSEDGRYADKVYQRFPNSVIGEQLMSQVIARNKYGSVTEATDLTGTIAKTYYSKMGTPYFSTSNIGDSSTSYTVSPNHADVLGLCPSNAAYAQIAESVDGTRGKECFDLLGRSIRKLEQQFDGSWAAQDMAYDKLSRSIEESVPFAITAGSQTGALFSTTEYDILSRSIKVVAPDFSKLEMRYEGYRTIEVNNVGQQKVEVANSLNEVVEVIDNNSKSVYYTFDNHPNMVKMEDHLGNFITIDYDDYGRKIGQTDPDKGTYSLEYNGFGQVIKKTDAKGQVMVTKFDALGREIERIDYFDNQQTIESVSNWVYDIDPGEPGELNPINVGQVVTTTDSNGYEMTYVFDQFGRQSKTTTKLPGLDRTFYTEQTYDQYGRGYQTFDYSSDEQSNGKRGVEVVYNEFGFGSEARSARQRNGAPVHVYERTLEYDVLGNVTKYVMGNGVIVSKHYNQATGRLEEVTSLDPFTYEQIQDLNYKWDTIANLEYRYDYSGSKTLEESFLYDHLNRLTEVATSNGYQTDNLVVAYDDIGNITRKSDISDYLYGTQNHTGVEGDAGPHAVISAGGKAYLYDDNGNNISGDGRSLSYSTFDKVIDVSRDEHRTTFAYDPGRSRYKRVDTNSDDGSEQITYYLPGGELIEYQRGERAGETEYKRYFGMVIETILYKDDQFVKEELHYLLTDHLGSIDVVVDNTGKVIEEHSFDPWGERRDPSTWLPLELQELANFDTSITTRGFTGHEMVDGVGIIHMNGRIYDPALARFLQADPYIQDPSNSQSLNRYSYVINNPLNAVDPSGFFFSGFSGLAVPVIYDIVPPQYHVILNIVATVALVPTGCLSCAAGVAAGTSFHSTYAQTGDFGASLSSAAISAASVVAFDFIGGQFTESAGFFQNGGSGHILTHAVAGGILSELQGGQFGHGFLSAGLTKALNVNNLIPGTESGKDILRTVTAAVIGGTISQISGGKFANGALTAGFAQAYNGNSFWAKARELGEFAKQNIPGYQLAKCASGANCSFFTWVEAVADVASLVIPGGPLVAVFLKFRKLQKFRAAQRKLSSVCGCCFVGETLVQTKDGLKPIKDVQLGELVASRSDDNSGEIEWKPVVELFVFDDDRLTYELLLANEYGQQQTFEVTHNHPFYVENYGWIDALELSKGMKVPSYHGGELTVVSVTSLNRSPVTYNFEVEGFHTYFVGEHGAWVHNMKNCGGVCDVTKAAKSTGLWQLTKEGTAKVVQHGKFGKFHKSKSDGLWWSKDTAGHGGSKWKVFTETKDGLKWRADADQFGDFIVGKHKGDTGKFIPWKELKGK